MRFETGQFTVVKLGYALVYLFFSFLLQNIDCEHSLENFHHVENLKTFSRFVFEIFKKNNTRCVGNFVNYI